GFTVDVARFMRMRLPVPFPLPLRPSSTCRQLGGGLKPGARRSDKWSMDNSLMVVAALAAVVALVATSVAWRAVRRARRAADLVAQLLDPPVVEPPVVEPPGAEPTAPEREV